MKKRVLAIGLDAADPLLIEKWISQGHLKCLGRLREQGTYCRLKSFESYRAETPWTTFLTGCAPQKTGYWEPVKLKEGSYEVEEIGAYNFAEYAPFYSLNNDYRVAVFDLPHSRLSNGVNGLQVLAWGAHAPLTSSQSQPSNLLSELIAKHGEHPTLNKDHASCLDLAALRRLEKDLEIGIARRSAICQDLLKREDWDLFLTAFGETHSAQHYFWHLSQPNHPLYQIMKVNSADDLLLKTFKAVDRAIEEIISQVSDDTDIVVFATHGMDINVMDLPSMVFLPEFLYRVNFPTKVGLAGGSIKKPPGKPITQGRVKRGPIGTLWSLKHDSHPLKRFLRRNLPTKVFNALMPFSSQSPDLISPFKLQAESNPLFYQPAVWYQPFWSQMKAFALPSFSEGYIRINLQGREPQGIVSPSEYDEFCEQLSQQLLKLIDRRTGQPMVKDIIRTRGSALDNHSKLPDADLVVIWQENSVADVVDSPDYGRIGPVPYFRTGSHRSRGFFLAKGATIPPNSTLPDGHTLDLAPTILNLMGATIPDYLDGKSLIKINTPSLQY
ncbi:type I phosphodiesterase/nucleotide pyrophosphatase [Gloeothece citriformis PCC 7424]|uniref:Type I phosphodiesterase/nucleotide pyrophosphatase n=1 Tax=Gloeothece citriformis (strain PCC 7424) TaxID=65393 RepID=B7KAI2_GLOC7|nr:alkaline phosphatase family protein [Gloeothece citriformis]ACK72956.1 type I phosphodiesterase/nucleotide pyrophosphatase [Gloeothece citriformis PCC 7424]